MEKAGWAAAGLPADESATFSATFDVQDAAASAVVPVQHGALQALVNESSACMVSIFRVGVHSTTQAGSALVCSHDAAWKPAALPALCMFRTLRAQRWDLISSELNSRISHELSTSEDAAVLHLSSTGSNRQENWH